MIQGKDLKMIWTPDEALREFENQAALARSRGLDQFSLLRAVSAVFRKKGGANLPPLNEEPLPIGVWPQRNIERRKNDKR